MRKVVFTFVLLLGGLACEARHYPVDPNSIQGMIYLARDGDVIVLEPGVYTGSGNHSIDFQGKAITVRSVDPDDPNTVAATIIDCRGDGPAFTFETGEGPNSALNGLTIMNGTTPEEEGGAIFCVGSGPTIKKCTFRDNFASYGGAIWCDADSSPVITDCQFTGNSADFGGAAYFLDSSATIIGCSFFGNFTIGHSGGAVRNRRSSLIISDSIFVGNWSHTYGGAIFSSYEYESELSLENCSFIGNYVLRENSEKSHGGALNCGAGRIANCLFAGNSALMGGALFNCGGMFDKIILANCTFVGNYAPKGSSLYDAGLGLYGTAPVQMRDCILWDGMGCIETLEDSQLAIDYSNISGGWPGDGNINADPCFASPGYWGDANDLDIVVEPNDPNAVWVHGDYHLKSQAGRLEPNEGRWVRDDVTSLCIDAGDSASLVGSEPFPNGGIVNMGFYGGTEEASKSYFGQPPCETIVAGDINGDCAIDWRDFEIMARHWLGANTPLPPGQATDPDPADGATGVLPTSTLSWTAGSGAASHDIYLGISSPGTFLGNQSSPYLDPANLACDTTYYWRIDEVNDLRTTMGEVWSFKTAPGPEPATNPSPANGASDVGRDSVLSWTAGAGATSHKVYIQIFYPNGLVGPMEYQHRRDETGTTFYPGLSYDYTLYWRIDEVNDVGTTRGQIWAFTTESLTGAKSR